MFDDCLGGPISQDVIQFIVLQQRVLLSKLLAFYEALLSYIGLLQYFVDIVEESLLHALDLKEVKSFIVGFIPSMLSLLLCPEWLLRALGHFIRFLLAN
jgi:hypothetical protein